MNSEFGSGTMQRSAQQRGRIHWQATVLEAVAQETNEAARLPVSLQRLIRRQAQASKRLLHVIILDVSASTLGQAALQQAKGVVQGINQLAYRRRDKLALLSFGNDRVRVVIPPTKPAKSLLHKLDGIKAGGGTPLRQALLATRQLLRQRRLYAEEESTVAYLLTDGRSRDSLAGVSLAARAVVIDTENSEIRLHRCRQIAQQLNAEYVHINQLPPAQPES